MQRLVIAFGGRSSEHEVSVRSATEVLAAVDRRRFEPVLLGVTRSGALRTGATGGPLAEVVKRGAPVVDVRELRPDAVFPLLHGPYGEDGTFQGWLETLGVPYVGSGVTASGLCMDKALTKTLAAAAGIPVVPGEVVRAWEMPASDETTWKLTVERLLDTLGSPLFVKPANQGSSVGVTRAEGAEALRRALALAFEFDPKVLVERAVNCREIELAVLGTGDAETLVSAPGEITLPPGVWYDYDTKYETDVAGLEIPADLPADLVAQLRDYALRAFRMADCHGLARVDFLVDRDTLEPYLNEPNTMPGFTSISMYPKLMAHAGVPYGELITRLCELGMARQATRSELKITR